MMIRLTPYEFNALTQLVEMFGDDLVIARDGNNSLFMYMTTPHWDCGHERFDVYNGEVCIEMKSDEFPSLPAGEMLQGVSNANIRINNLTDKDYEKILRVYSNYASEKYCADCSVGNRKLEFDCDGVQCLNCIFQKDDGYGGFCVNYCYAANCEELTKAALRKWAEGREHLWI